MPSHKHFLLFVVSGLFLLCEVVLSFPLAGIQSTSACSSQSLEISQAEASLHEQRSIWGILWSCVSTIIACCWVAVHPNMLEEGASWWRTISHRLIHMALMIMAPELLICWAIRQWLGARALLHKEPYKSHNSRHSGKKDPNKWTMTHGFFLQMGGFRLIDKTGTPKILTANRLELLVDKRHPEFPIETTAEEVKDRSKRDELSKIVAAGQALWFLAQCISRKVQGLATTELEIVTVAFATLNLFIYYFWLYKPMDVQTTIKVRPVWANGSGEQDQTLGDANALGQHNGQYMAIDCGAGNGPTNNDGENLLSSSGSEQNKVCARICLFMKGIRAKVSDGFRNKSIKTLIITPLTMITALFEEAHSMLLTTPEIKPGAKTIPMFYALDLDSDKLRFIVLGFSAFIGVVFGAIHCAAWNNVFPTILERTIWRASTAVITGCAALGVIISSALYIGELLSPRNTPNKAMDELWGEALLWVGTLSFIPYAIARVLILVEAFISLRHLPPDALLDIRWTSFVPHVG